MIFLRNSFPLLLTLSLITEHVFSWTIGITGIDQDKGGHAAVDKTNLEGFGNVMRFGGLSGRHSAIGFRSSGVASTKIGGFGSEVIGGSGGIVSGKTGGYLSGVAIGEARGFDSSILSGKVGADVTIENGGTKDNYSIKTREGSEIIDSIGKAELDTSKANGGSEVLNGRSDSGVFESNIKSEKSEVIVNKMVNEKSEARSSSAIIESGGINSKIVNGKSENDVSEAGQGTRSIYRIKTSEGSELESSNRKTKLDISNASEGSKVLNGMGKSARFNSNTRSKASEVILNKTANERTEVRSNNAIIESGGINNKIVNGKTKNDDRETYQGTGGDYDIKPNEGSKFIDNNRQIELDGSRARGASKEVNGMEKSVVFRSTGTGTGSNVKIESGGINRNIESGNTENDDSTVEEVVGGVKNIKTMEGSKFIDTNGKTELDSSRSSGVSKVRNREGESMIFRSKMKTEESEVTRNTMTSEKTKASSSNAIMESGVIDSNIPSGKTVFNLSKIGQKTGESEGSEITDSSAKAKHDSSRTSGVSKVFSGSDGERSKVLGSNTKSVVSEALMSNTANNRSKVSNSDVVAESGYIDNNMASKKTGIDNGEGNGDIHGLKTSKGLKIDKSMESEKTKPNIASKESKAIDGIVASEKSKSFNSRMREVSGRFDSIKTNERSEKVDSSKTSVGYRRFDDSLRKEEFAVKNNSMFQGKSERVDDRKLSGGTGSLEGAAIKGEFGNSMAGVRSEGRQRGILFRSRINNLGLKDVVETGNAGLNSFAKFGDLAHESSKSAIVGSGFRSDIKNMKESFGNSMKSSIVDVRAPENGMLAQNGGILSRSNGKRNGVLEVGDISSTFLARSGGLSRDAISIGGQGSGINFWGDTKPQGVKVEVPNYRRLISNAAPVISRCTPDNLEGCSPKIVISSADTSSKEQSGSLLNRGIDGNSMFGLNPVKFFVNEAANEDHAKKSSLNFW